MQAYKQGELVHLFFPFADAATAKRRPALVLLDTGDEDIVVARVTSQMSRTVYDVDIVEWSQAGLLLPSVIRVNKLATLEKRIVERRIGELSSGDWSRVLAAIQHLWALEVIAPQTEMDE